MNLFNIGTSEILLLAFLIFLLFGPRYLSEILRSIGKAIYELQKTFRAIEKDLLEGEKKSVVREGDKNAGR